MKQIIVAFFFILILCFGAFYAADAASPYPKSKPKKYLLAFADSRLKSSAERLKKQATEIGIYDEIIIYNENDLDPEFREKYKDQLVFGSRGYGYFVWKPYIVLKLMERIDEGDIIHYSDIGNHLIPAGRDQLLSYFEQTQNSPFGILAFKTGKPDRDWTKGDLIDYFMVREIPHIIDSGQVWAGSFFIRKNDMTLRVAKYWYQPYVKNFSLMDDSPSNNPDFPTFKENRYDQSAFSILCKLFDATLIQYQSKNEMLKNGQPNPIRALRDTDNRKRKLIPATDLSLVNTN